MYQAENRHHLSNQIVVKSKSVECHYNLCMIYSLSYQVDIGEFHHIEKRVAPKIFNMIFQERNSAGTHQSKLNDHEYTRNLHTGCQFDGHPLGVLPTTYTCHQRDPPRLARDTLEHFILLNSLRPSDAYMRQ